MDRRIRGTTFGQIKVLAESIGVAEISSRKKK